MWSSLDVTCISSPSQQRPPCVAACLIGEPQQWTTTRTHWRWRDTTLRVLPKPEWQTQGPAGCSMLDCNARSSAPILLWCSLPGENMCDDNTSLQRSSRCKFVDLDLDIELMAFTASKGSQTHELSLGHWLAQSSLILTSWHHEIGWN